MLYNPNPANRFLVSWDGTTQAIIQGLKLPEVEYETHEIGDLKGDTIKTAGKRKVGDMEVNAFIAMQGRKDECADWLNTVRTGTPNLYKKTIFIRLYSPDGDIVGHWQLTGVFPKKVDFEKFERNGNEIAKSNFQFSVDDIEDLM